MSEIFKPQFGLPPTQSMTIGVMNMSFRGYTAMNMLQALVSDGQGGGNSAEDLAKSAFKLADAFIAEAENE